jgi:RNA-binding protein
MSLTLTGAEKSRLRGRGQTLEPALKIGRDGATPTVLTSLSALLGVHDLVKVRFTAADRDERETLCTTIATGTDSVCVGAVGHTALFYRPKQEVLA